MAIIRPNQQKYAQCQLPDDVEAGLDVFVDEFYADMRAIELELDAFNVTQIPAMKAAIQKQVELRKQLLDGAPVPALGSLKGLQDNLFLTNAETDEQDPSLISLDERKLGSAGIIMIHGKMFAKTQGNDFEAFRQLWTSVGGDYEAYLALGDGIADSETGSFTTVQYVPGSKKFPYINQTWSKLESYDKKIGISKFKQSVIWKESINNTTSNYNKLKTIGFEDFRISQMFSGQQPSQTSDVSYGYLQGSVGFMKSLTQLLLLPFSDDRRLPKWQNEVAAINEIVTEYLKFRTEFSLTSYVFKADLWELSKAFLNKADLKEIFENRPEVQNMALPSDIAIIGDLLNQASKLPIQSTVINAYLLSLPKANFDLKYETEVLSTGSRILNTLHRETHPSELFVLDLLQKVKGSVVSIIDIAPPAKINKNETKTLLGGSPQGTPGEIADTVASGLKLSPDEDADQAALGASVAGDSLIATAKTANATVGLPTSENYMTNIFRRVNFQENFNTCVKKEKRTSNQPADEQAATLEAQGAAISKLAKNGKLSGKEKKDLAGAALPPGAQPDKFIKFGNSFQNRLTGSKKTPEQKIQERAQLEAIKKVSAGTALTVDDLKALRAYLVTHSNTVLNRIVTGGSASDVGRASLAKAITNFEKEVNKTSRDPDPADEVNKVVEQLRNFKKDTATNSDDLKRLPLKASARNKLSASQGASAARITGKYEYKCNPKFENDFSTHLAELEKTLRQQIIRVSEAIKRALLIVQDIVDQLISKIQIVLDQVLGALERLLTLDLSIGGAFGFDSSLIKCSWALDFGLKIDLFGPLLKLMNEFFRDFGKQFRDCLKFIQDMITKAICVPIRLLESFLGGVNALLNLIGCSLKDIKLPTEILDLLKALLFTFDIRSLVLKKGYDAYLEMTLNFHKNQDSFKGLSQFASLCQKNSMKSAMDAIDNTLLKAAVTSPQTGADAVGGAATALKKESIKATFGQALG